MEANLQWAVKILGEWSYLGLALALIICPEIALPLAGLAVAKGELNFASVILCSIPVQLLVLVTSYLLVKKMGISFIEKFVSHGHGFINRANRATRKHGSGIVFIGLLIPGLHGYFPYVAALSSIKPIKVYSMLVISTFIWTLTLVGVGYVFGDFLPVVAPIVDHMYFKIVLLLVSATAVLIWYSRRQNKKPDKLSELSKYKIGKS